MTTEAAATVLAVETQVLVRIVLADYLRGCDYKVVEAANTDEAKLILGESDVKVDVALIAVDLIGASDGFALARWIRENKPSIKVQLLGTISKAATAAVDLCEEVHVLAPPYSHQALVDRIKRLLAIAVRNQETT
ncbi:response regulator [Nordella sp. HKS 07]|uniref:response regulator n=1 Tax=Nordella sp. HKS 07 TaxID=2712222 RepID=UPI0013E13187|nr:response regulator [Nordella sp. HKS 07]QIG46795.1 response regulator [Nordella sp. HKS 07]